MPPACASCVCLLRVPPASASCLCLLRVPPACASCVCLLLVLPACASCVSLLRVPPASASCECLLRVPPACASCVCLLRVPPACASCECMLLETALRQNKESASVTPSPQVFFSSMSRKKREITFPTFFSACPSQFEKKCWEMDLMPGAELLFSGGFWRRVIVHHSHTHIYINTNTAASLQPERFSLRD